MPDLVERVARAICAKTVVKVEDGGPQFYDPDGIWQIWKDGQNHPTPAWQMFTEQAKAAIAVIQDVSS